MELESHGFHTVAAAAFVGQHAFASKLAPGRPDAEDIVRAEGFAEKVAEKVQTLTELCTPVQVPGDPVAPYYTPLGVDGQPAKFLKAKPLTDLDKCTKCGLCAAVCPMVLKNTLIDYWRQVHKKWDYLEISTPQIMKRTLWETSGHWDHYKQNMYTTVIDEEDFAIKPMMGQPAWGFPKDLQKVVLKGKKAVACRPGELLEPVDFEAVKKEVLEFDPDPSDRAVISYCLYPKVYRDYKRDQKEYGYVTRLGSHVFFHGLSVGETNKVNIADGKTLVIKYLGLGEVDGEGMRTVSFELNGIRRDVHGHYRHHRFAGYLRRGGGPLRVPV